MRYAASFGGEEAGGGDGDDVGECDALSDFDFMAITALGDGFWSGIVVDLGPPSFSKKVV